jgi:hypothetical protein
MIGRPSLAPGIYFRLLLIGYFEGIDSERGIAWRAADSLALRTFLGVDLKDARRRRRPAAIGRDHHDKGYHSNRIMIDLDALGVRSNVAEPDRGRRDWTKEPQAQAPVYANRRRMRGRRGRRLMRQRGERIERSFAHVYDTGGMRRTHLRGHTNILKRVLIHAGGFKLGLVMRQLIGLGTPDHGFELRPVGASKGAL